MISLDRDLAALPGVGEAVEQARDALAGLALLRANRGDWSRSAAAAAIRSARASAMLEDGVAVVDESAGAVTDPILAGAIRCTSAVAQLAGTFTRAPLQVLARLHLLAAADDGTPADQLGRPAHAAGAAALGALSRVIAGQQLPGPILAAVVHGVLLSAAPFPSANGIVARAAARVAAVASGLDRHALGVPDAYLLRHRAEYRARAAAFESGDPSDTASWTLLICRSLVSGADEARSIAAAISEM